MNKEEILHLGDLARIRLSDAEVAEFETEIDEILAYVAKIQDIVADTETSDEPEAGSLRNVMRDDEITNDPGEYTKDLLEEMPETEGQYLKVKKILQNEQ